MGVTEEKEVQEKSGKSEIPKISPFKQIWLKPGPTLLYIFRTTGDDYLHRLAIAFGVFLMISGLMRGWLIEAPDPVGVMILTLLIGPIGGIMITYTLGSMISVVAKWFGTELNRKVARVALAWTHLPFILSFLIYTLTLLIAYFTTPTSQTYMLDVKSNLASIYNLIPAAIIFIFGVVIRISGFKTIMNQSIPKAAIIVFISSLIVYVPLAFILSSYILLYFKTLEIPMLGT